MNELFFLNVGDFIKCVDDTPFPHGKRLTVGKVYKVIYRGTTANYQPFVIIEDDFNYPCPILTPERFRREPDCTLRPGDWAECVDSIYYSGGYITVGRKYIILDVQGDYVKITNDRGNTCLYKAYRFQHTNSPEYKYGEEAKKSEALSFWAHQS